MKLGESIIFEENLRQTELERHAYHSRTHSQHSSHVGMFLNSTSNRQGKIGHRLQQNLGATFCIDNVDQRRLGYLFAIPVEKRFLPSHELTSCLSSPSHFHYHRCHCLQRVHHHFRVQIFLLELDMIIYIWPSLLSLRVCHANSKIRELTRDNNK